LTESVSFKAKVQRGNRVQVPRLIRWQFKLEPEQVLKVTVKVDVLGGAREDFFARMTQDGRVTIPKLVMDLLKEEEEEESLVGCILEVDLEPAEAEEAEEEE